MWTRTESPGCPKVIPDVLQPITQQSSALCGPTESGFHTTTDLITVSFVFIAIGLFAIFIQTDVMVHKLVLPTCTVITFIARQK